MASAATVTTRAFAYVPDNTLKFSGEYTRQFKILNQWQRIRLGVLCAITPDGTSNITDCPIVFGVCTGSQGIGNWWTPYFIGASLVGAYTTVSTRIATYNQNTNNPYYSFSAGQSFKKSETTSTAIATLTTTYGTPSFTGWFKRRVAYYIDITKSLGGSGAGTITVYGPALAAVQSFDARPDHFMAGLDAAGIPVVNGQTYVSLGSTAVNLSEALGPLDTFNLLYPRATFPLEISAMGASIIYANEAYYGIGGADETFEQYYAYAGTSISNGSTPVPSNVLSGGTGWGGPIVLGGSYSNPSVQLGLAGTSSGFPDDTFESYGTGSIFSGITINAGTGWQGAAYVYP